MHHTTRFLILVYKASLQDGSSSLTKTSGVAIVLKKLLDNYYFTLHENEAHIRKRRIYCHTHMKQHLLKEGSNNLKISQLVPGSTRCKTCECMLKDDVPESFFGEKYLSDSSNYVRLNERQPPYTCNRHITLSQWRPS